MDDLIQAVSITMAARAAMMRQTASDFRVLAAAMSGEEAADLLAKADECDLRAAALDTCSRIAATAECWGHLDRCNCPCC